MKKPVILIAAAAFVVSMSIQAEETGSGCGLGAEVMKGKSGKGANIAAALLNNLVIPNTTFMTTGDGLMGCDPTKTVEREKIKKVFVAANFNDLSSDTAQGGGAHLTALAHIMGIQEQDITTFEQLTRVHYEDLFGAEGATSDTVLASLNSVLGGHSDLAKYVSQ